MDKLKKYLQENQDGLDVDIPGEAVWQRIQQSAKPAKKPVRLATIIRFAAAACLLAIIFTAIVWQYGRHEKNTQPLAVDADKASAKKEDTVFTDKAVAPATKEIAQEKNNTPVLIVSRSFTQPKKAGIKKARLAPPNNSKNIADELSQNYAQLVNLQLNRLRITPVYAEDANYFKDFKMQLKQMDEDEAAIKKDIKVHGLNDVLLQQLINVYQQKLMVLKNLQTEINKMNNQVKQKQLPTDSTKNHFINI